MKILVIVQKSPRPRTAFITSLKMWCMAVHGFIPLFLSEAPSSV